MGLQCKIIRGANDRVELVEAPNGQASTLFSDALNYLKSINDGKNKINRLPQEVEEANGARGKINAEATNFIQRKTKNPKDLYGTGKREEQEKLLKQFAKEKGYWVNSFETYRRRNHLKNLGHGAESFVFHEDGEKHVIKLTSPATMMDSPLHFLDRLAVSNYLFSATKIEVVGFTEFRGSFHMILKQPFVNMSEKPLDKVEIVNFMRNLGFEQTTYGSHTFLNDFFVLDDAHNENVVRGADGNIYVIDVISSLNTPIEDEGGMMEYKTPNVVEELSDPTEKAVDLWAVPYTDSFKEVNGDWESQKTVEANKPIPILESLKGSNNRDYQEYDGMFSKTTTGITFYDDILEDSVNGRKGYHLFYKRQRAKIVMMSPEEYLKRVRLGFGTLMDENIVESSRERINEGFENGDKIDMPMLSYLNGRFNQEGRNRATVARDLGESLIPVLIAEDVSRGDLMAISNDMVDYMLENYSFETNYDMLDALEAEYDLHRDGLRFIEQNVLEETVAPSDLRNGKPPYKKYTTNLSIELDLNGEPKLKDVLTYLQKVRNEGKRLSKEEMADIANNLYGTDINSLDELYRELRNTFYKNGYFKITEQGLSESRLYTESEQVDILSTPSIQNQIKDIVEKIESEYLSDNSDFDTLLETRFKNDQAILFDFNQMVGIGKYKVLNPLDTHQNIAEVVAGITNREFFEDKVAELPYESLIERYFTDRKFADEFFNRYSNLKRIPVFKEVDDNVVQRLKSETATTLKETLRVGVDSKAVTRDIEFLNGVPVEVWEESADSVKPLLKQLESSFAEFNIDVSGLSETFDVKTQQEVLNFINTLGNFSYGLGNMEVAESDIEMVADIIDNYFGNEATVKETFQAVESTLKDKTLVDVKPTSDELKLFQKSGLVKTSSGFFQKVNASSSLEKMYDIMYKVTQQNPSLLPKEAYYPTAYTVKDEFSEKKFKDPKNKEGLINDLKRNILESMYEFDTNVESNQMQDLEKLVIFKSLFGHPLNNVENVSFEGEFQRYANFKGNFEYLTTEFVGDFYNYVLDNKLKDSNLYNNVLRYFDFTEQGITLTNSDPFTIQQINLLSPDNKIFRDLKQYALISKDDSIRNIYPVESAPLEIKGVNFKRAYYANNPSQLPAYKGEYATDGDLLITLNTSENFIKTNAGVYERIDSKREAAFFRQLPILEDSRFNNYGANLNIDDVVDTSKYQSYTEVNRWDTVEVQRLYDKGEAREIKKRIDECG